MKTRFSDILKIRKEKLSEIERELLDVRNRKRKIEEEITKVDAKIKVFKQPQIGDFSLMQVARDALTMLRQQKEDLVQKHLLRERQIEGLKGLYQEANIEYEKIAYLNEEAIKKVLKQRQLEESKALDEIANILFVNKKEKVGV